MRIEEQKAIGKEVLENLRILAPRVCIAGGAVRDWYLGQEAADLDIYFNYHPTVANKITLKYLAQVLQVPESDITELGLRFSKTDDSYNSNPDIKCVFDLEYKGMKIQLINIKSPYVRVESFCFTICQAYTVDCEDLRVTTAFRRSLETKIIFATGTNYSKKDHYIKKIISKFPDYIFIDNDNILQGNKNYQPKVALRW